MSDLAMHLNVGEQRDTFAEWAAFAMIVGVDDDQQKLITARAVDSVLDITIFINGVQVDAERLLKRLEEESDRFVDIRVTEAVKELRFDDIHDILADAERAAQDVLRRRMAEKGIEWRDLE